MPVLHSALITKLGERQGDGILFYITIQVAYKMMWATDTPSKTLAGLYPARLLDTWIVLLKITRLFMGLK